MATRTIVIRNPVLNLLSSFAPSHSHRHVTAQQVVDVAREVAPAAAPARPHRKALLHPTHSEIDRWVHPELGLGL